MKRYAIRILCALCCAAVLCFPMAQIAKAETEKEVFSGIGAELSEWPVEMYPIQAFRVDIEHEYVKENKLIEMDFQMLSMPRNLLNVMLWDGWHAAYGAVEMEWSASSIHVIFAGAELEEFLMLDHVYLILLGSVYGEQ